MLSAFGNAVCKTLENIKDKDTLKVCGWNIEYIRFSRRGELVAFATRDGLWAIGRGFRAEVRDGELDVYWSSGAYDFTDEEIHAMSDDFGHQVWFAGGGE